MGPDAMILVLWILSFKPAFFYIYILNVNVILKQEALFVTKESVAQDAEVNVTQDIAQFRRELTLHRKYILPLQN